MHSAAGRREARERHVAVDGFAGAGLDAVGLVPDADLAVRPDLPVEASPGGKVFTVPVVRVAEQAVEILPILNDQRIGEGEEALRAQKAAVRFGGHLAHHAGHGGEYRQPFPRRPRPVHPHANEKQDERALAAGGIAAGENGAHAYVFLNLNIV